MRAVVAELTVPRYLATAVRSRAQDDAGWRRGGLLRVRDDVEEPALPGPRWVRLRTELAGICGSDVGLAHARIALTLSAYYPARRTIPGHELVGVVEATGPQVRHLAEGDRVALDPVLSCRHRGFDPVCSSCAAGRPGTCERFDLPGSSGCTGVGQGFDARLGGGFGEVVVAHEDQCVAVGRTPSRRAVLLEPAAVGLHAALRWERHGERAVVIGPGTIGLLTTAALRRLHPDLHVTVVSPDPSGDQRARGVGADRVVRGGEAAVHTLAAEDGGRVLHPDRTALPILERGVDVVYDCVGKPDTIDLALHLLRPGGTVVLVGAAGRQRVDWSLVWNRELTVRGTINAGPEPALDGRRTCHEIAHWLADDAYPVDAMVTHLAPLGRFGAAMQVASAGSRAGAGKVVVRPEDGPPLVGALHAREPGPPPGARAPDAAPHGRGTAS